MRIKIKKVPRQPNIEAYGGFLNAADNLFAIGGDIQMHGGDYSNGAVHVDAGGTHEMNPNQGVQVGVDPEGTPNLVEEGEVIFNDYVYSNRIMCDEETKEKFHISKKREMAFADLAKYLERESAERPNDPISIAALKIQMESLAEEQERQKAEMQAEEAREAFDALSPEEQVAVMQQAEAQQADAQAQQEAMMQEQAMAEQQAAMQQQGIPMGMDAAMQGQMMPQEVVPEGTMIQGYGGPINHFGLGGNLFLAGGDKSELIRRFAENGYNDGNDASIMRRVLGDNNVTRFIEGLANDPLNTLSGGRADAVLRILSRMSELQLERFFNTGLGQRVAEAIVKADDLASGVSDRTSVPDKKGQMLAISPKLKMLVKSKKAWRTIVKAAKNVTAKTKNFGNKLINGDAEGNMPNGGGTSKPNASKPEAPKSEVSRIMQNKPNQSYKGTESTESPMKYINGEPVPQGGKPINASRTNKGNTTKIANTKEGETDKWGKVIKRTTGIGAGVLGTLAAFKALYNGNSTSNRNYIDESSGTSLEGGESTEKEKSVERGEKIKQAMHEIFGDSVRLKKGKSGEYNSLVQQLYKGKIEPDTFLSKVSDLVAPSTVAEGTSGYAILHPEAVTETDDGGIKVVEDDDFEGGGDVILEGAVDASTGKPIKQGGRSVAPADTSMYAGRWNEGTIADNWYNYTYPGLKSYLGQQLNRYNEAANDEERNAIRQETIDTVNGIQEAYSQAYQDDMENVTYSDEVGELQKRFNNANGNMFFLDAANNVTRSPNSLNGDVSTNGYYDRLWGPYTRIRNWGTTEFGKDNPDYYKDIVSLADQLNLDYAPGTYTYGKDENGNPYKLYTLSQRGAKAAPEASIEEVKEEAAEQQAAPTEEKAKESAVTAKKRNTPVFEYIPRYFGLGDAGPLVALGLQAAKFGAPDDSLSRAALNYAINNGVALADYRTAGNYFRYNPMDVWAAMNRQAANVRATDKAIQNSTVPYGTRMAGLVGNGYNGIIGEGELYNKGWLANADQAMKKAQYDTAVDQFNAGAFNETSRINAQLLSHNRQYLAQLMMQKAREDAESRASWYRGIYGNIDKLFTGLGAHERENRQGDMIAGMINTGLFGTMSEDTPLIEGTGYRIKRPDQAAKGGKLNRKKRKGGLTY